MFPFGHGLSYTSFAYSDVEVGTTADGDPEVILTVTNVGPRRGVDVPQVYVAPPAADGAGRTHRLAGWAVVELDPGQACRVRLVLDEARVFSAYDPDRPGWTRVAGTYSVRVARSAAGTVEHEQQLELPRRRWSYGVTG